MDNTLSDRTVIVLSDDETYTGIKGCTAVLYDTDDDMERVNESGEVRAGQGFTFKLDSPEDLRKLANLLEKGYI